MAKTSLRKNWRLAEASRLNLSDEQINREIDQMRTIRQRKRRNEAYHAAFLIAASIAAGFTLAITIQRH
jgi:hypothetical protein